MLYIIRKSSIRSNKDLKLSKFSVKRRGGGCLEHHMAWHIIRHTCNIKKINILYCIWFLHVQYLAEIAFQTIERVVYFNK